MKRCYRIDIWNLRYWVCHTHIYNDIYIYVFLYQNCQTLSRSPTNHLPHSKTHWYEYRRSAYWKMIKSNHGESRKNPHWLRVKSSYRHKHENDEPNHWEKGLSVHFLGKPPHHTLATRAARPAARSQEATWAFPFLRLRWMVIWKIYCHCRFSIWIIWIIIMDLVLSWWLYGFSISKIV